MVLYNFFKIYRLAKITEKDISFSIDEATQVKSIKIVEYTILDENEHKILSPHEYQFLHQGNLAWLQINMNIITDYSYVFKVTFIYNDDTAAQIKCEAHLEGEA